MNEACTVMMQAFFIFCCSTTITAQFDTFHQTSRLYIPFVRAFDTPAKLPIINVFPKNAW